MTKDVRTFMERAAERSVGTKADGAFTATFDQVGHMARTEIEANNVFGERTIEEILGERHQQYLTSMVEVPYAGHPIMPSAVEEKCEFQEAKISLGLPRCGQHATHKLGEEGGNPMIHNLTAYVCCEHFRAVMGRCTP